MTKADTAFHHLTGKLLIAMPDLADPRFQNSVVLICSHSADGAMGVIVNKVIPDLRFADMLRQIDITVSDATPRLPLCFGGPVEMQRGFVLHDMPARDGDDDMLLVGDAFALSATMDILRDIARGHGPAQALVVLGYAGWGAGQLEAEIAENSWLTADATPDLVFDTPLSGKWAAALASLGISPLTLSAQAGRA